MNRLSKDEAAELLSTALQELAAAALTKGATDVTDFGPIRRTRAIRARASRRLETAVKNYHSIVTLTRLSLS